MGFSLSRPPEYLGQNETNLFIFRMKVPLDCQSFLNKKEVKYSLKTRCIYSARKHIASILPFLQAVFEGIRQGVYSNTPQADLCRTIKEWIHTTITEPPSLYNVSLKTHILAKGHPPAEAIIDPIASSSPPQVTRIHNPPPLSHQPQIFNLQSQPFQLSRRHSSKRKNSPRAGD